MRRVRPQVAKSQPLVDTGAMVMQDATPLALIQALIPLGLRAAEERLRAEVQALAGARYARDDGRPGVVRWGHQAGSV